MKNFAHKISKKIKINTIFTFVIGLGIGFLLNVIFFTESLPDPLRIVEDKQTMKSAMEKIKKIRILCFGDTAPKYHSNRTVHVMQTWGRHCDKIFFSSTLTDMNLNAIGFTVTDDHDHMWGKVKLKMQFIHKHFINDFDWF